MQDRIAWDHRYIDYETGEFVTVSQRQPTHANYFCLLGGDGKARARFRDRFGRYGVYEPGQGIPRRPRDLDSELLTAVREHGPLSKRALIRLVRIRTSTGLAAIDRLIAGGQFMLLDRLLALPGPQPAHDSTTPPRQTLPRDLLASLSNHYHILTE